MSILIFIYTIHFDYLKVYTKSETLAAIGANKSVTEIFIGEKEKWTDKGTDKQYVAAFFVTQYNSSLSSFVPNFRILTQVVAEKSLTEQNVNMYYIRVTEGKMNNWKKKTNEDKHLNFHSHNTLCLPEGVHKIWKTLAPIGVEKSVTEISVGEKEKCTY